MHLPAVYEHMYLHVNMCRTLEEYIAVFCYLTLMYAVLFSDNILASEK